MEEKRRVCDRKQIATPSKQNALITLRPSRPTDACKKSFIIQFQT